MQWAERFVERPAIARTRMYWRRYRRFYRYDRAMTRALDLNQGAPDGVTIERIIEGWGDSALKHDDPFLWSCIQEVSRTRGQIFQLGSGLTTLLLGIYAQCDQKHLWSIDHDRHWASVLRAQLQDYGISLTHLITASLKHDGKRVWYNVDISRLPKTFGVVICDGDNVAPTGYPGVFQKLIGHLAPGAVIVVRNVRRDGDARALVAWAKANGASSFVRQADEPYVKIVLPGDKAPAEPEYSVRHSLAPRESGRTPAARPPPTATRPTRRAGSTAQ